MHPEAMGETFKVIVLSKGEQIEETALQVFGAINQIHRL
jgi:hypothetical protein